MDKKDLKKFDYKSLNQNQKITEFFARLIKSWKFVIFQLYLNKAGRTTNKQNEQTKTNKQTSE